jgi:mannose-1-phosphate guanylyltransferase
MRHAVIMAGGVGSRFWPSSRVDKPKQFLNLLGERSMIQSTIDRITPIIPAERIWIITNEQYVSLAQSQLPELPPTNIIGEPVAKNTAPCVAIAAAILQAHDPEATMVVLPADHHISRPERFREILLAGLSVAEQGANLVTIGITPHRPETGYGYIQLDEQDFIPAESDKAHRVKTFAEKPDLKTALNFMASGDFLWNSGMFIWQSRTILDQFREHQPAIYKEIETFRTSYKSDLKSALNTFYHSVTSISIDYAIMEKASAVYVVPGEFGWSDVGSWVAVYEHGAKDLSGNVLGHSNIIMYNSKNCLIKTSGEKLVAMVGLEGLAVVETDDTLLLCRLDASQDVKKIVDNLVSEGFGDFK